MDSYFGQIGHSFYGGPNGQSFSVKETFPNKVALDADLAAGFTSSIQVGEYVIISYGNPHAAPVPPETRNQYEINRDTDYAAYSGQTYNATLWQKKFENDTLSYELIVAFETSSPEFVFITNVQDPGEFDPTINNIEDISTSEIIRTFQLSMPNAWNIAKGKIVQSNPGLSGNNLINVEINRYPNNDEQNESDTIKYIHFTLPKPWNIAITKGSDLAANASPKLTPLSDTETAKQWSLQLPAPWGFEIGTDSDTSEKVAVDPGVLPSVVIDGYETTGQGTESNITKYIHFKLPKAWNIALGSDSGRVNPVNFASVSMDNDGPTPDTTKYVHIKIPDAWNIALGADSDTGEEVAVSPGTLPSVVIDRQTTAGQGQESNNTKYIHFKLPKAWEFAVNEVELINPNTTPEVTINASSDTKYLHFKLPVAQYFTTDAFGDIVVLGPTESPRVRTWFNSGDTINRYPKVELSLPRAAKTMYGPAMAYTSNAIINYNGSTATDWNAISELTVGDIYINTTYAAVHKIVTKTSTQAITEYLGSMQLTIPNIQGNPVNPYDANGNPAVPTVATSAIGPVSSWNINVDVIKAPVFKKSADSGFVASTAKGVISSVAANDGITYTIKVPKGTKITTPLEQPDITQVAKVDGDLYLDNDGQFRRYSANYDQWQQTVNIKGNSFLIKNATAIVITAANLIDYSGTLYQKMGQYVADNYTASYSTNLRANEILNIDYQLEQNVSSSHWLYKSNGEWTGSKLTGDVSNTVVENIWQDEPEDNKAYSVTRINELRATISTLQTKIAAIEAAIEAAWGELPIIE